MQRSRSREKPRLASDLRLSAGCDPLFPLSNDRDRDEEYSHSLRQVKLSRKEFNCKYERDPPTGTNSINLKFSSTKKASGIARRVQIAENMSTEKQTKGSSPGVIARLMGLDTLPSPGTLKLQEAKRCSKQDSSKERRESFTASEDCLLPCGTDKLQNFKDVFEVMEAPKDEMCENHKRIQTSLKHSEMDSSIARCGFIDKKYPSTYKPSSLLSEHLHNPTLSPTAPFAVHASHSTSTKSSSSTGCESSRSERYVESSTHLQRTDSESFKKTASMHGSHPFNERSCYLPERLSYPAYKAKVERGGRSSEIVILKPGLGKAYKAERTISSAKYCQFGNIDHREFPMGESLEQYWDETVRKKLCDTADSIGYRVKGSKQSRNNSTNGRKVSLAKSDSHATDGGLGTNSSNAKGLNSQFSSLNPDNWYEYGQSSEIESSVDRVANRQLPEQWKLTQQFQEINLSSRASNSLGEILALSDKEKFRKNVDLSNAKKASPSGVRSKDGWKDGFSMSFPSFKSLPSSSLAYEICRSNSKNWLCSTMVRNSHVIRQTKSPIGRCHRDKGMLHLDLEENETPDRVIHVTLEEQKNKQDAGDVAGRQHVEGFEKFSEFMKSEENGEHLESDPNVLLLKETSLGHDAEAHLPSQCIKSPSACSQRSKEADQPSPVSVLELPSVEKSKAGCLEKISSTLQDLRMQLHFLKLESTVNSAEEIDAFICSDEDEDSYHLRDILNARKDEDDRDYSYLLDMLIYSGIPNSKKDWLFTECNSIGLPVGLFVFENLEKKYKLVEAWSRSERKLLFDLINSTLADIIKSSRNMRPWLRLGVSWLPKMVNEDLIEEIWQKVAKRKKKMNNNSEENFIDPCSLDLGDDRDLVGIKLQNMLIDDLTNEMVILLSL
ncbi:hypothetical protein AXF42_Ash008706 [Apostasia shenzhenica]|uniref:DUF4378 domain-containing protein n=1 Tax=Apostasia shenzhenica TaxID=1088818 RepID=A0A2I0B275_9ASPA|nr:hypothetical protein AXF42_Ash008706 [Apostasia shenzhenica]